MNAIAWFTGLPSSGKTTLARRVHDRLRERGVAAVVLDSDELRELLGAHSYAPADRAQFYRQLGALAALLANQGLAVLVAATAPRREDRDSARAALEPGGPFVEVWVNTPLSVAEARDPKGLYAQARRDPANELPGVGASYEPPTAPDVTANGGFDDEAVAAVEARLSGPSGDT